MIGKDDYPVYNHRERPGIGRDHLGNLYYNCFSISLKKDKAGNYLPYLFRDFIQQYNQYKEYQETCQSCISRHRIFTFDEVDRSALDKKFLQRDYPEEECEVDESPYYYCPLVNEVISDSQLNSEAVNRYDENLPAKPISAILGIEKDGIYASNGVYAWDDDYLFEFIKIGHPINTSICSIYRHIISSKRFAKTKSERSFLIMWIIAMFHMMESIRNSFQKTYLEEIDLDQLQSKLFAFVIG